MDNQKNISGCHPGVNPQKLDLVQNYINPGSILDVGCGNGLYSYYFKEICPNILQIDLQDRRSSFAKNIPFYEMDANNISTLTNKYDNIFAFDIIEHLEDDLEFLDKAYNLLNSSGKIFISVPNIDNSILEELNLAHIHFTDKTHKREYSSEELNLKLYKSNFLCLDLRAHKNKSLTNFSTLFQSDKKISKFFALLIKYEVRILEKIGIFRNDVIADWFGVFEVNKKVSD